MQEITTAKNIVLFSGLLVLLLGCDSSGSKNGITSYPPTKKINRDTVLIDRYLETIGADVIKYFDLNEDTSALMKNMGVKQKNIDFYYESRNVFVDGDGNPLHSFNQSGQRLNWIKLNEELYYSILITDAENIRYAHVQTFSKAYRLIDSHPIAMQGGDEWDLFRRVGQFNGKASFKYTDEAEFPRNDFLIQATRKVHCMISDDGKINCDEVSSKLDSVKMK